MFESRPAPAAAALHAVPLDSYAGLAPDEIVAECEALGRLESQVKAHQLAAARALETSRAAASLGATSTGALLANTFGGDPTAARRMLGQAARLHDASQTQEALGRGEVTLAQAELIARTVKDLPGHAKGWEIRFTDGIPEYIPPPTIDPQRRPLRKNRYRPQAA